LAGASSSTVASWGAERAEPRRRITGVRVPGNKAAPSPGSGMGAGGPWSGPGVGCVTSLRGPCVVGFGSALRAAARVCGVWAVWRWRASDSWLCGVFWKPGSSQRGRHAKRRRRCCGAESSLGPGAGGGDPVNFRALHRSRRRAGVASSRTAGSRHKTQRASGDGCVHPHGEKVVGDDGFPRHRKPPDRTRVCDVAPNALEKKPFTRA
jgi:hypothetical protein